MDTQEYKWYQRIIIYLIEKYDNWYYNCSKNRHRWGYTLSESGEVYLEDENVPKEMWKCLECGIRQLTNDK